MGVNFSCLIITESTWNCFTISGRSLCFKYSSIQWAIEDMLTEHLCVLYAKRVGGCVCKTYYMSHRNHLTTQLNTVFRTPSASRLGSWTKEEGLKGKRWHEKNKVLSIGLICYLWYIFEVRKFIKSYAWK